MFIHVDCDDLWVYRQDYRLPIPDEPSDSVYREALPRLMALFDDVGVKATFFVVGRDVETGATREFLQAALQRGHAVANHSFSHSSTFGSAPLRERLDEVRRTHDEIGSAVNACPIGFRAPGYSFDTGLRDGLAQLGYRYDSTSYPGCTPRAMSLVMRLKGSRKKLGASSRRVFGAMPNWYGDVPLPSDLVEIPILTPTPLRLPVHTTALFTLGKAYTRALFETLKRTRPKGVFLVHAIDGLSVEDAPELKILPTLAKPLPDRLAVIRNFLEVSRRHSPVTTVEACIAGSSR